MRAKVKTTALGTQFLGKEYPVLHTYRKGRYRIYELDITPTHVYRDERVWPFIAREVEITEAEAS